MSLEEYGYLITDKTADQTWEANEYKILNEGSGGGTFAQDSAQADCSYLVEYFYFERFIDCVLGKTVKDGSTLSRSAATPVFDGTQGSRPEEHPYCYNYFARSATVVPMGVSDQTEDGPVWNKAKITVVFRPLTFNVLADENTSTELDRFVTRIPEGSAEFQQSLGLFYWQGYTTTGGNKWALDVQPAFVVPSTRWMYTWHQIPCGTRPNGTVDLGTPPNIDTVLPLLGSINDDTFDGFNMGTVLFSSWSPKLVMPSAATSNNYYWDVCYNFGVRDMGASAYGAEHAGWNFAYNPIPGVWDRYTTTGTGSGNTMYEYNDLSYLFAVTW